MQAPKGWVTIWQTWKQVKPVLIAFLLICVVSALMYWSMDRFWPVEPLRRAEEIIQQGQPVWLKPGGALPYLGLARIPLPESLVQVSTRVFEQPLTGVVTSRSLTERIQDLILHPDQAVVQSEVDRDGNTRIKVLTPVTPINTADSLNSTQTGHANNSPTISPEKNWMFVETEILIPRVRSCVKPLVLCSKDGDIELGAGFEYWRLEQKPIWLPEVIFKPLEGTAADLIVTTNRIGTGLSVEANRWLDIGGGFTLDLQEKKVESVIYFGVTF